MGTVIGVDIGQKRDPTAIAVVEEDPRRGGKSVKLDRYGQGSGPREILHYVTRHLERLPLGTTYPRVAKRIAQICVGVVKREEEEYRRSIDDPATPHIYVDATGVGKPIVDFLIEEIEVPVDLTAVYFTHGDQISEQTREHSHWRRTLGKAALVSRLQVLLQAERLHLPQTSEAEALAKELLDYEIRVDENANDRYGAFRVGTHDDLVTALGLAVHAEPERAVVVVF